MIEENLFWEKFRPNSISGGKGKIKMILLPRIKKLINNGLTVNFLFYGSSGLGKTTLTKILTENTDCLRINCRIDNLEYVRNETEKHCTQYGVFSKGQKVIWLEEFDGASWQMRETLRPLIELYDYVRFIATANTLNKFTSETDQAVLSRFNLVNFNPLNDEEKKFLKDTQIKFLSGVSNKMDLDIEQEIIEKIIDSNFPDFRRSIQQLQELYIIGDKEKWEETITSQNQELFNFLFDGKNKTDENYFYVMNNYKDKTEQLLNQLGRPLFNYLMENKKEIIDNKGFNIIKIQKEYNAEYQNAVDPEIHLISMITDLKEIFKK